MNSEFKAKIEICQILGIDKKYASQFEITSRNGSVITIHYIDEARLDDPIVASLRGIMIDIKEKTVICATSYRSTPAITVDDRLQMSEDGKSLIFTDEFGRVQELPYSHINIFESTEGTVLRFCRHAGRTITATHRSANARGGEEYEKRDGTIGIKPGAHWAPHMPSFTEQFDAITQMNETQLNDTLFPPGCNYSPFVYAFFVTHPSRLLDTTMKVSPFGFITYLGAYQMWSMDDATSPYDWNNNPDDPRLKVGVPHLEPVDISTYDRMPVNIENETFIMSLGESLTSEEADNVLLYGTMYPTKELIEQVQRDRERDVRLTPGGALIVTYFPEEGVRQHFRIESEAYRERSIRHDGKPNQYKQFVLDMNYSNKPYGEFVKAIVPVKPASYEDTLLVLRRGDILSSADIFTEAEFAKLTQVQVREVIGYYLTLIANPHRQLETFLYQRRFQTDLRDLIAWLVKIKYITNYKVRAGTIHSDRDAETFKRHVEGFLKQVRKFTTDNWPRFSAMMKKKGLKTTEEMFINDNINKLIQRQNSETLLHMIKLMRDETATSSIHVADVTAKVVPAREFPNISNTKSTKTVVKSIGKSVINLPRGNTSASSSSATAPTVDLASLFD